MPQKPTVYALGTLDTKGHELAYIADRMRNTGVDVTIVDLGTQRPPQIPVDISRETVAAHHPEGASFVLTQADRGRAVTAMSEAAQCFLTRAHAEGRIAGVIGIGGSGGTALITPGMRALPVGVPKVMVSTVASGNTLPYVGTSDIGMFNAVVDVAGLNRASRQILGNAAHAIAGMAAHRIPTVSPKPTLGMTMFGVTTPCVTAAREALETAGWDCLVFHATGTGGQAMEKLAVSGMIQALLDLTTTEVADEVVGGVFRAGPDRFDLLATHAIPCVMSVGALDMVNFGARDTVPERFRHRRLHVHNAQVTLMRTTPEENRDFARWMCPKLNRARGPLTLLLPEGGVSLLDAPGQPFHDPEADAALFEQLEAEFESNANRRIVRLPHHINDPAFATAAVREFERLTQPLLPIS